ncbi:hypothetical protein BBO99_00000353 [Phytophthora kernoviae]|uniref:HECT-type E3 ubiquitin transferase n=2 Tax=Phytophthora kernoviae TaxID=325452 RepID=A0A421F5J9_9STRA|nr:hypothetical protein G195_000763 [Phytophthora kernoviae 00238/432]KAG2532855.1 hypothetical protein JM16_000111 [Phytophthora kernoviae]KAG2533579.1 hypothetical protein JM18_000113 [Phytophthora kernoviae]RLN25966.1 hypothetical protein BBI17_006561 [Phytophthora kernoviae]RLN86102.1 hypothetical protein BBO99_00000353 [Phytophthora kernoviae]
MDDSSSSLGGAFIAAGVCVLLLFCCLVFCAGYCHRLEDNIAIDSVDLRSLQLREDLVDTVLDAGRSEWQCLNPEVKNLQGDIAEQLHRKNAASMGFFSELTASGQMVYRKTDSIALDIDPKTDSDEQAVDFEGVLAMTWREKKRWFLKQITQLAVPYTESMFKIDVHRSAILEDALPQLSGPGVDTTRMREHLNIGFIGEPALDAGGVLREWFVLVCQQLFSAERGLFVTTHAEDSSYWINSESEKCVPEGEDHLQYFTFAGRLLGKAILDGLVVEVSLALPLLKHLLGVPITFSDLEFLDEELFKHLSWVRDNDQVDALCVTFSIQTPSGETVELKPGGNNIDVTDENKMEYLSLVLRYRMLDSVAEQLTALLKGLYEVIPKSLLTIFDYQELDFYLSGLPTLNVTDWQNNSRVRHAVTDDDTEGLEREIEVVRWFWDVVGSFTDDQRARLLQFATGSSRVPVEGFKALTSASGIVHSFTLQLVPIGTPPLGMCPRAHTCFNRIDLPLYETKNDLNSYLSLVIQMEITGFGFE